VAADAYRGREWIGTPSPRGLLVSFTEAEALRRRGVLQVPKSLAEAARRRQPDFALTLPVYEALRAAGVVAKAGFRFGTHLRAYRANPDDEHAEWLIHCVDADTGFDWVDVARGVRLAHGVRKSFLLALVHGEDVAFVHLAWFKP
jgi:tRNA-intron endonuclease